MTGHHPAADDAGPPGVEANARFVVATMTKMVPEFERDDQLFWVEEYLAGRPVDQHEQAVDRFGAWLGEYLRERVDGHWLRAGDGWVVVDPGGTTWDPYGRIAELLADRSVDLKSFAAAAIGE